MASRLQKEFQYFLDHQADIVSRYRGKVVVISGEQIVGAFDTEAEAIRETQKTHELGTFLVQKAEPGDAAYTQTFHSRVAFPA